MREDISVMWLEGYPSWQIAEKFGMTAKQLGANMSNWRKTEPEKFPYRKPEYIAAMAAA